MTELAARRAARRRAGAQAGPARALRLARAPGRRQPRGARGGARDPGQARPRHPPPAQQGRAERQRGRREPSQRRHRARLFGKQVELFVITGYSGAGKSEAIAAFEDSGYFCVDNLPPRMIASLGELFRLGGSGVRRAAVVTDVRGGDYFADLLAVLGELEASGLEPTVALPRGRRGDARRPLQGDPPPPPAGARRARRRGDPRRARDPRPAARARRRRHGHHRAHRRDAAPADRHRPARPAVRARSWR